MYLVEEYKVSKEELINLLKSLLKLNKENKWIEFKLNNDNPSIIGEYISALSNSATLWNKEHAYLIYGIDDKTKENSGTDLSLLMSDELSGATINYYGSGVEYYRKLIEDLEKHKPLFFQKKKIIEYNTKLKEYNHELSKVYSKMEDEIDYICKMKEVM